MLLNLESWVGINLLSSTASGLANQGEMDQSESLMEAVVNLKMEAASKWSVGRDALVETRKSQSMMATTEKERGKKKLSGSDFKVESWDRRCPNIRRPY